MLYEIDFLPVGDGGSFGDAICLRYSADHGRNWYVGVIDGGTQVSGESLCDHIKKYYHTDNINFLVCTHPDKDHTSGLSSVFENFSIDQVMMHCPWDYVDYIYDYVSDGRVTKERLRKKMIEDYPCAYKIYELASQNDIPIFHAFSDNQNHGIPYLTIAGPSSSFYLKQLLNFRAITDFTEAVFKYTGLLKGLMETAKKAINRISETRDDEKLVASAPDATSSEKNSGIILLFDFKGKRKLFAGDAGAPALEHAADYLERQAIVPQDFSLIQSPQHGSKQTGLL